VEAFFDDLGAERAAAIRLVSADAGSWITNVVDRRAPNAIRCMDPFHVVAVRHEAPCNRERVRDPPLRLVAAGR
jgi:transposase